MVSVEKARDRNGVLLKGDFFDFDRLYFAILKFTGFHGMEDKCTFTGCEAVCESLLGLCYELRHAWQGDRDIVQMYNGIHDYWFDDYTEHKIYANNNLYVLDDDEYDNNDDEPTMDDFSPRFLRKDFPTANDQNMYFSILLTFPEAIFYVLILLDLLKQKDVFLYSRKCMAEKEDLLQELNKEYVLFQAEEDIARMTIFVKQTLHELYRFIGEEQYFCFIEEFDKIKFFSLNCNLDNILQVMSDYCESEYKQDEPQILASALFSFFK